MKSNLAITELRNYGIRDLRIYESRVCSKGGANDLSMGSLNQESLKIHENLPVLFVK